MPAGDQHTNSHRIACFVSSHGFGHAARLSAVADAVYRNLSDCRFDIFTSVPAWFFRNSLAAPFTYHSAETDLGLVQQTPFKADVKETIRKLNAFLPFDPYQLSYLSYLVRRYACELILCDISPLGLAVGRQSGVPTVLIENFTWDWLYEGYGSEHSDLQSHIRYLRRIFSAADYHVQAEPVCRPQPADLTVKPIWRKFRNGQRSVRKKLGLPENARLVLITTGGISDSHDFSGQLIKSSMTDTWFVLPAAENALETRSNVILLPHDASLFHPDLVHASDAVIGKAGYSTLAEVYGAGVPFGYVSSGASRESRILAEFIDKEMIGLAIEEAEFYNGSWMKKLQSLLSKPRQQPRSINGADQVAAFVCSLLADMKPNSIDSSGPDRFENHLNQR